MKRKECVAMLLAGGQGSRLHGLTSRIAKPAVSFGGKYRIIDFSLSNCVNSGIDTVGVLTQYKPMYLNAYLGNGVSWDLDVSHGGVHILPPYATEQGGQWYKGTADSIFQNIDFIDTYNPKYVLILSGDHLYKMDYAKMLRFHKKSGAELTVSVIEVPLEEASRFGIMSVDEDMRIVEFEEKPEKPKSNLASMGIYIFDWKALREALIEDHENPQSDNDFGKNVIPMMLREKKRLYAYTFFGYWQDGGTIESYYEAQMGLLKDEPDFNIFENNMRIYSNANISPPHYVGKSGVVEKCIIANGCIINGTARNSILSSDVTIKKGAVVEDSILLPGAVVRENAKVTTAIVGEEAVVDRGADFCGSARKKHIAVLSDGQHFRRGDKNENY